MSAIYAYPNPQSPLGTTPAVGGEAVDVSAADWVPTTGPSAFRSLYVGGTGDVVIKGLDSNTYTLKGVPAGAELHVSGSTIVKTGTTATNMVALY